MFNQKRFDELKNKAKLSPAEKAELKVLQKQASKQQKAVSDNAPSNEFGITKTTAVKPYPIRFTETDHNLLSSMSDNLINHHSDEVQQQLGSLREINKTKLIRAAIHALNECSPAEQIAFIKDVKFNMASTRQVHKGADDLITDPVAIALGKLAALCMALSNARKDSPLIHFASDRSLRLNDPDFCIDIKFYNPFKNRVELGDYGSDLKLDAYLSNHPLIEEATPLEKIKQLQKAVIAITEHWHKTGTFPAQEDYEHLNDSHV